MVKSGGWDTAEFRAKPENWLICADDAVNYAKPTLSNAQSKPLGDKMSDQLKMRIEAQTWVKEIQAEQHQLVLEKDGQLTLFKAGSAVGANPGSLPVMAVMTFMWSTIWITIKPSVKISLNIKINVW